MKALRFFHELAHEVKGKTILLDVDGTLIPEIETDVSAEALQALKTLQQNNDVFLCSNTSDQVRAQVLGRAFGSEYINGALRKPNRKILELLPQPIDKPVVVIGDKYSTDGRFARAINAEFIKVKRIRGQRDPWSARIVYWLDDCLAICEPFISLLRPAQWLKNILVFAPLFFAGKILASDLVVKAGIGFVVFCAVASAMYILNDIVDVERDRLHPRKRWRPLAANTISPWSATGIALVCLMIAAWGLVSVPAIWPAVLLYVVLNILYSYSAKHVPVVDLVLITIFYILRIVVGGVATNTHLSPWIILCVLFGSLFVIVGKRRAEFSQIHRREVLNSYSTQALDYMLVASATLAIMSYSVYSIVAHDSLWLVYSSIFVLFALFRLLNDIYTSPQEAESPELLVIKDGWILVSFVLWIMYVFIIFYNL